MVVGWAMAYVRRGIDPHPAIQFMRGRGERYPYYLLVLLMRMAMRRCVYAGLP